MEAFSAKLLNNIFFIDRLPNCYPILTEKPLKSLILGAFHSLFVPPSRPNMNDILEDTRDLARIWDLYGHLIKEA